MTRSILEPKPKVLHFMLLIFLSLGSVIADKKLRCRESERKALLEFKERLFGFTTEHPLSSWTNTECCEWKGIRCGNGDQSGRVITLDLSPETFNRANFDPSPLLAGNLSSSLLALPYLNHLDLSYISFYEANAIPSFIGDLRRLRYLNLSHTGITGQVPPELGNLSALEVLDLSDSFKWTKTVKSMDWVSRLTSLKTLDLSYVDLSLVKDWATIVSNLARLSDLRLRASRLFDDFPLSVNSSSTSLARVDLSANEISPSVFLWLLDFRESLTHIDLNTCYLKSRIPKVLDRITHLEYLDLGINFLEGLIPDSIGSLKAMKSLDLGNNQLRGSIPQSLGDMVRLEYLDLSTNMLEGEIPRLIWEICTLRNFRGHTNNLSGRLVFSKSSSSCASFSLESLSLEGNRIQGPLPDFTLYPSLTSLWLKSNQFDGILSESLGGLTHLETLDVSENSIRAMITEAHLSKLFRLRYLDLSSNSGIAFKIRPNWTPPFQADYLLLMSCNLGPSFPSWLRNQKSYTELDLSNSGISDSIPNWFWNLPKTVSTLNLSNNHISATSHGDRLRFNVTYFNLSSTEFAPSPAVDLSGNKLRGSVPMFLLNMRELRLSRNEFSDLNSLCNGSSAFSLRLLDISYNQLSGKLPDCWSNAPGMETLTLSHNRLSGEIPSSVSFMAQISELHLSNNRFSGGLPFSLRNCTQLMVLDAGENELTGSIPAWIGTGLENLVVLRLRSNKLSGTIPTQLCHLKNLQVLDLSFNKFSGTVPKCVANFSGGT